MKNLIYAADDEQDILDVLREFLLNAGFEVQTFDTGDKLFEAFRNKPCDLAVLDIMMPGTDGLTICKKLREISTVPIVILTAKESETDQIRGFMLGGDDYLVKPFSPSLLVVKIKALLRRASMINAVRSADVVFADLELSRAEHDIVCSGNSLELTVTEFSLMECLMEQPGTAIARDILLDKVWGINSEDIETRVTDETVRRIRKKLTKAGSRVKISAIWGYGYKLEES